MKIYIHTDLEGVSGIENIEMMARDHARHREAEENLMADLNAAVDGAFEGGAEHVTVLDSHGGGRNFILDMLDKRAEHDTKPNKKWWGIRLNTTQSRIKSGGEFWMRATMPRFSSARTPWPAP